MLVVLVLVFLCIGLSKFMVLFPLKSIVYAEDDLEVMFSWSKALRMMCLSVGGAGIGASVY